MSNYYCDESIVADATLADDAMGEEPFGESYDASGIVPMRQYRSYITDGSLNGEWEEVEA